MTAKFEKLTTLKKVAIGYFTGICLATIVFMFLSLKGLVTINSLWQTGLTEAVTLLSITFLLMNLEKVKNVQAMVNSKYTLLLIAVNTVVFVLSLASIENIF